ncbi:MAG: shikimate dehydrogenase [Chitinispirillaceae bacterium]
MESPIAGHTRCVCLLGYPVSHSISPQIHNHAFRKLNLPFVYIPLGIAPRDLPQAVYTLRAGMAGANVTIPHKKAVVHYCDEISELSTATGTVNTLYMKDGRLCGTTTDPDGFFRALEAGGHVFGEDHVVILGNGGTAKTLGAALLLKKRCRSLVFAGRTLEKAQALASELEPPGGTVPVNACRLGEDSSKVFFDRCTLLVNCTSAGMTPRTDTTPLDQRFFHPGMTVFDTIYNPRTTRFLKEAAAAGCRTQNGLLMLLYQGLESFRYWTGKDAPHDLFDINKLQNIVDTSKDTS